MMNKIMRYWIWLVCGSITIIWTCTIYIGTAKAVMIAKDSNGSQIKQDEQSILYKQGKDDVKKEPQYVPGEVLVKFKEGAVPETVLKEVGLAATDIKRIHPITPAVDKFMKDYKLEKDSSGWYSFLGKKYKEIENIDDEEAFKEIYKGMSDIEKGIYRSYKLELPKEVTAEEMVFQLRNNPNVEYAEPNYISKIMYVPNDPLYSQQWAHKNSQAELGWDIERGDSNVVIAIIDTGVDYNHEDLAANIWRDRDGYAGKDFVDIDTNAYQAEGYGLIPGEDYTEIDNDPSDFNGHGTHCAGIIGAVGNNSIGVAGIAHNCKIMPVRAGFSIIYPFYGAVGLLENDDIGEAITYAVDNKADVISMSFGDYQYSYFIHERIRYAYANNVVLVSALGNEKFNYAPYPAAFGEVIAVGASNPVDERASEFSNYGHRLDVLAPGLDIISTVPNIGTLSDISGYRRLSGTSMACPYVAGLAGLILSKNPDFNTEEVKAIIQQSSDDLGATGRDDEHGYGRVNVYKAMQSIEASVIANITTPTNYLFLNTREISISGFATGTNFHHYQLSVSVEPSGKEYQFPEISSRVDGGVLGILSQDILRDLGEGEYVVTLNVTDAQGVCKAQTTIVTYVMNVLDGWPIFPGGWALKAVPFDVNGDNMKEIFVNSGNKFLFGWDFRGNLLPHFPIEIGTGSMVDYPIAPLFGDVDGDGGSEIIVVTPNGDARSDSIIQLYNFDGELRKKFIVPGIVTNLAVIDLNMSDDNHAQQIIATSTKVMQDFSSDVRVSAYDYSGKIWEYIIPFTRKIGLGALALGDLNNDKKIEIVVGTVSNYPQPDQIVVLDSSGNRLFNQVFSGSYIAPFIKDVAVADLDLDGLSEIVVTRMVAMNEKRTVYVLDNQGSILHERIIDCGGVDWFQTISCIANIDDRDANLEICVIINASNLRTATIHVLKNDLSDAPGQWPYSVGEAIGSPTAADVNGDGKLEILARNVFERKNRIYLWDAEGKLLSGYPRPLCYPPQPSIVSNATFVVVDDVNADSMEEILCVGDSGSIYVLKTIDFPPAGPTDLITSVTSTGQIVLKWIDNSYNEIGFKVERGDDGVLFREVAAVGANSTTYNDSGLSLGQNYYYRVCAYNEEGNSEYSNTATAYIATSTCDVNRDGVINILDLVIVRNNIGKTGAAILPPSADVNGDGNVNVLDLLIIRNNRGKGTQ